MHGHPGERGGAGVGWEIETDREALPCARQTTNEGLLHAQGTLLSAQCLGLDGEEIQEKGYTCIHGESLCCAAEINTTLSNSYTPMKELYMVTYF